MTGTSGNGSERRSAAAPVVHKGADHTVADSVAIDLKGGKLDNPHRAIMVFIGRLVEDGDDEYAVGVAICIREILMGTVPD